MNILYFTADWCVPCGRFFPTLQAIANERNIPLFEHEVSENPEFARQHQVQSVPTVVVLGSNDDVLFHASGVMSKELLDGIFNDLRRDLT